MKKSFFIKSGTVKFKDETGFDKTIEIHYPHGLKVHGIEVEMPEAINLELNLEQNSTERISNAVLEFSFSIIAKIIYDVNRAYCKALGDDSQPTWENAPDWHKESLRGVVRFINDNPECTASDLHERWRQIKYANGFEYGRKKDIYKKTHPYLVDFDKLSKTKQMKNVLLAAVVKSCLTKTINI